MIRGFPIQVLPYMYMCLLICFCVCVFVSVLPKGYDVNMVGHMSNSTGSSDGFINLWKCGDSFRSLEHLYSIPVVN